MNERQITPSDQEQDGEHNQTNDYFRQFAPNSKFNLHPPSKSRAGGGRKRIQGIPVYICQAAHYQLIIGDMIKAFFLMFEGGTAWDRIVQARRSFVFIFFFHLLPMLLIVGGAEWYALTHWGKWQPPLGDYKIFTVREATIFEGVQLITSIIAVLLCTRLLEIIAKTFHGRGTWTQAFTTVVFGLSPMFLLRLLDVSRSMSPYAPWILGMGVSMWILYQGMPRIMLPDPTHAFGLYLSSIIVLVLGTGMFRVLTALYLEGRVDVSHSYIGRKLMILFTH
jgi:hypothetical protein